MCVCRGGFPAPTLAWYRNTIESTAVASNTPPDSNTTSVSVNVTYTFTPSRSDDKVTYICQSSFPVPEPAQPINQTSVQLYLNLKPSTPTVQQVGDATAGSTATLQCDTSGFRPAATIVITWKYNGMVRSGNQQSTQPDTDKFKATSTLQLHVLQREDNGRSAECNVTHSTLSSPLSRSTVMNVLFAPYSVAVSGNKQTVANGMNPLELTCTVGAANPAVSAYSWTGPGGVETMSTKAVTLRPTRDQDGAAVTCTARNYGSTTSQHVNLNLTYHPNTTISEGTYIPKTEGDVGLILHCSTDSKPISTIIWYHDGHEVSYRENNNQFNYNVGTVNRTDTGTYMCSAVNGIAGTTGDREKSVTLAVLFPPTNVELTGNNPGMVANGATLTLTCTADYSRPVSTIAWRKGSSQIPAGTPTVILGSQYGGTRYRETLTLTPTRDDDHAVITCSVWNNVTAQPLVKNVQFDLRYSPKAFITGWRDTVIEGTPNVDLTCTATSKPATTFTWYKDGTELGRDEGTQADNSWSYRIGEVSRSHTGQYRCKADNGISPVDEKSMKLTVQYPPDVNATGPDGTVNDTSVTITCSASGVPGSYSYHPWYYTWSNGHVSSHKLDLAATQPLTVTNLTYQHSGIYTCRVSNGIPPYGTPAALIREGSTSVITIKSNPVIIDKVDKVTTQLHQPTNFNITYYSNAGIPTVSCHRVFNNGTESVSVGNVTTETAVIQLPMLDNSTVPVNGTRATVNLTIDDESELGFHQVKLRNTIGTAIVDLQIQSIGPPEPPKHPDVSGVSTTSVNVSWNLGFHGGLDQTFVVQYRKDDEAWTNGSTLNTGLSESRDRQYVFIDSLSPGQLYYLRIYAYNEKGESGSTDIFTTSTPEEPPGSSNVAAIAAAAGGCGLALIIIVIVAVYIFWRRRSRSNEKPPKDTSLMLNNSAHVYENDFGRDRRKPPNVARRVPATPPNQDNCPSDTTSAGTGPGPVYEEVDGYPQDADGSQAGSPAGTASAATGPGPVYEEVDGHPEVGAGSRDESITATYEMLDRRQSENRSYEELQLPGYPQAADGSQDGRPAGTDSAGTGPGPVYEEVGGHPEVGAGSRDESITAAYEMMQLDRRQSENRSYEELQLPAPPEYENTRIP